ncbi:MAG: methionyl-tRNA formyltransferase [Armatimonadetes bacterium]|nr:methionyl-tRNA formyltransferase [Armatimonadota bacterium]
MRILFMGTSSFAVPVLEVLVKAGHEISAVVTQPDRPSGRGRGVHISPVKQAAVSLGLPVFQPEKIRETSAVDVVRSYAPLDAIVVAAFGQIVPQSILDIPKYGSINVHASLLPKYRGAAPVQHAIIAGETRTGVTTMLMDAGLDTGDILLQRETEVGPQETAGDLQERLASIGADLLIETLEQMERGELSPQPQDHSQATLAKSLKREDGSIDWRKPARDIVNLIRAFTPRPGAFMLLDGMEIKVFKAAVEPSGAEGAAPGTITAIDKDGVRVAAGEGAVRLIEVQPENRRRMNAEEFARGARLKLGTAFGRDER